MCCRITENGTRGYWNMKEIFELLKEADRHISLPASYDYFSEWIGVRIGFPS